VRAHLHGGIPKSEVDGFEPARLLKKHAKASGYFDFAASVTDKTDLKKLIETDEGVVAKEQALADAVEGWWKKHKMVLTELPEIQELMKARASLLGSFEKAVGPVGLLDRFQVAGVVATWWGDVQNDLRTITARGFLGLVEAWETSILSVLTDRQSADKKVRARANKEDLFGHRLVRRLLIDFAGELNELEAKKAELEAAIKGGTGAEEEEDSGAETDDTEELLSDEEVAALKKTLAMTRKALKGKQQTFAHKLKEARAALDEPNARYLVLGILRSDLDAILVRYIAHRRQEVVGSFESWWDKYHVTLTSIEDERDAAAEKLRGFLGALGYAS
jgi:type I restriction enzyme M protein